MIKAVVIGASGFIGSHLTEELVKNGTVVVAIDDLSTPGYTSFEAWMNESTLKFVRGSALDLPLLRKYFTGADYVFHQAFIPNPSGQNNLPNYESNSQAILNVLQAARDTSVKKVVFASSSAVYGNDPEIPKREDMNISPQSPYGVIKFIGEQYCLAFTRFHGLPTVNLRYFNVYGPRQRLESQLATAIPRFIHHVKKGLPPVIYGDGEQTRDFVFVKDVVSANILAAKSDAAGIYNIGSGISVTLASLARQIIRISGSELELSFTEPRPGEIRHSLADISRARTFGYSPRYTLEEGLKITIANS
jgi:UDP-glucose 4-epimerase